MDDLQVVAELGRPAQLPDPDELRPARDRLLAAAAAERGHDARLAPVPPGPPRRRDRHDHRDRPDHRGGRGRRWAVAGGATAATAAGIAAVLVLAPTTTLVPGSTTAPGGGQLPPARAGAAEVLHLAAVAASKQPDLHPRPNQFVFTEIKQGSGAPRRTWKSVDGTRDGLMVDPGLEGGRALFPGCRNGRQPARDKEDKVIPGQTQECDADPGYRPNLPTTADAMLAYLLKDTGDSRADLNSGEPSVLNRLAKDVLFLMEGSYLRPRSLAALYGAMAKMPGTQVVPDAVDGAGRHGVGVGWTYGGGRVILVFDRGSYAFLGTAYTPPRDFGGATTYSAVLRQAIVTRAGQLP
jgi:hypothetical protein